MRAGLFLLAAALAAPALPAAAGVTVLGTSSARLCYEAAEARGPASGSEMERCDQALELEVLTEQDRVATYVNRGILRLRKGEVAQAIADFDAATARDPEEPEAYLNKGMAALRLPRGWEQAVPLFDTALAKGSRRPAVAHYGRAVAHEMAGRLQEAYRDYREASRLDPEWREPRSELARFTVRPR
jgi:tetratricopeptide (TPR) repeat protein